jgi:signal transduction histidine kinase
MMARPLASLRSRVFAATALVAVVPMAAALLFVTRRVAQQAEVELTRSLGEAVRLVGQYHSTRIETATERASLVADLPRLKAAVATGHPPTVEDLAREYQASVRSDVFVVKGRGGRTLASLGTAPASWPTTGAPAAFHVDRSRLLETVSVPILLGEQAPELLGHLTLGFALDDSFAQRLNALTGSHVAVVKDGRVFASTLPRALDAALATADAARRSLDLAGEDYAAARAALGGDVDAPFVLVLRSRADALRPLRTLRDVLLVAAVAAVAVSLLLSWAVARTVTRPLAALTDAMKEIAATGDLARRLGPGRPWDDEDARLVARSFGTLTDSIARFQREASLRERLSALGRLSTVVAHEVRNPLMIIKGSLRTLRREGIAPEEVRDAAADIDTQVARLDRVVGDVLDFARPLRLEPASVDPAAIARDAAHAALEGATGVSARFRFDPGVTSLVTDAERLRAALVNLVANARDSLEARRASAPSGADPATTVEIGSQRLGSGRVLLWVEDPGDGIAAADLPHVFEPYFTTKRTGTGLGLAITRKTVEALGGAIRLESRPGAGTRVEIELPATPPATSATESR